VGLGGDGGGCDAPQVRVVAAVSTAEHGPGERSHEVLHGHDAEVPEED
jgi:hypothetical protein